MFSDYKIISQRSPVHIGLLDTVKKSTSVAKLKNLSRRIQNNFSGVTMIKNF